MEGLTTVNTLPATQEVWHDESFQPYRILGLAVFAQAFHDLKIPGHRGSAKKFLQGAFGSKCHFWCEVAGLQPWRIKARLEEVMADKSRGSIVIVGYKMVNGKREPVMICENELIKGG